jgi:hypothetical protein
LKRILSLFFLAIFLFQVGGYYVVFWAMEHRAKSDLLVRLDADDYSNNEAIVLTIPLSLPYPVLDDGYDRVNGDFKHQGESYRLVKQKWENDTLFIVCVKDKASTKIAAAFSDFTKFSNDLPVSNKKALNFLTKLYKDFRSTEFRLLYKSRMMYERVYFADIAPSLTTTSFSVDSPPPELVM